jgi:hypothetical protein
MPCTDRITRPDRLGHRGAAAGQARRHLRAPAGADSPRRTACCCSRRAHRAGRRRGTLAQQLEHRGPVDGAADPGCWPRTSAPAGPFLDCARPLPPRELIFPNGCGGFTRDGHEYVITLQPGQIHARRRGSTCWPIRGSAPSCLGERAAYTWLENAHEFRLTPWSNDPVQDPGGEALYLRDEQTGEFWSPRRCRPAARRPTSSATASATRCSSTPSTASPPSCGSMWRWTRR